MAGSRVSDICKYMSNKHHLTLAEFIRVYVTTQGDNGYVDRPATGAKRLVDAIYAQPEVLEALRQHPASGSAGIVTAKALRKEMKALEETGENVQYISSRLWEARDCTGWSLPADF